jgi:hypothetical protein
MTSELGRHPTLQRLSNILLRRNDNSHDSDHHCRMNVVESIHSIVVERGLQLAENLVRDRSHYSLKRMKGLSG